MLKLLKKRLHPFVHPSFRNFFLAQFFSLIGTWSHELARSWLVLEIAGTTTALGTLLLFTSLPGVFLFLHGGALADRKDARKLLIVTKIVLSLSAFLFFYLTKTHQLHFWMIMGFGLIEGLVNSYDGPAFSSIFARTIPREDFQQALAIQSTGFHVARMLGPAVAGLIMAWSGPAYVFLFDSLSYIFVIYAVSQVLLRPKTAGGPALVERGMRKFLASMKFFFNHPTKRYKMLQLFLSIILIVPLLNLVFRSYLKQKFSLDAEAFGYLFSFPALGAMLGAIYMTLVAPRQPIRNLILSVPFLILGLIFINTAKTPYSAALLLGVCGFFSYLNIASITQSLHLDTPDNFRGRLGSILTLGFTSIAPLMSYPIGIYTDIVGFEDSIHHFTLLFALGSLILAYSNFLRKPRDIV